MTNSQIQALVAAFFANGGTIEYCPAAARTPRYPVAVRPRNGKRAAWFAE